MASDFAVIWVAVGVVGARYKRQESNGKVTHYIGNVEVVASGGIFPTTTYRRTIAGVAQQSFLSGTTQTHYLFTDQLGSLVKITDQNGVEVQKRDFDAFGEWRDPANPSQLGVAPSNTLTMRGYTGHEHVDDDNVTNVIHANGRIYDPQLGRFLQADPVIQAPGNPQSWNAYSYCFNNPLTYTDPTGTISLRQLLGIAIAIIGTIVCQGMDGGFWAKFGMAIAFGAASGGVATGTWKGALYGAFSAGLTFGVGWAANTYQWGTMATIAAQAVSGGILETIQGGNFGNGFVSAGLTAAIMPVLRGRTLPTRVVLGALIGGTISEMTGGKFANGAISGAIQGAMAGARKEDAENPSSVAQKRDAENPFTPEQEDYIAEQARYNLDTAIAWEFGDPLPQQLVDGVTGFGDAFGAGYIRRRYDIDGGVNNSSKAYMTGELIGTFTPGLGSAATLRIAAYAGRSVKWLTTGRYWRIGPSVIDRRAGMKPFNYGSGRNIPMLRIGNFKPNSFNHFDLRILGK